MNTQDMTETAGPQVQAPCLASDDAGHDACETENTPTPPSPFSGGGEATGGDGCVQDAEKARPSRRKQSDTARHNALLRRQAKEQAQEKQHENTMAAHQKLNDVHNRQKHIAVLLEEFFGNFGKENPELWARRAYLQIVGMVYVRLTTDETGISNEELASLARILTGQRGVASEIKGKGDAADTAVEKRTETNLKERTEQFISAVREVYGTNLDLVELAGDSGEVAASAEESQPAVESDDAAEG